MRKKLLILYSVIGLFGVFLSFMVLFKDNTNLILNAVATVFYAILFYLHVLASSRSNIYYKIGNITLSSITYLMFIFNLWFIETGWEYYPYEEIERNYWEINGTRINIGLFLITLGVTIACLVHYVRTHKDKATYYIRIIEEILIMLTFSFIGLYTIIDNEIVREFLAKITASFSILTATVLFIFIIQIIINSSMYRGKNEVNKPISYPSNSNLPEK